MRDSVYYEAHLIIAERRGQARLSEE
ncbi:MAG: hypothetical protein ACJAQT_005268 [Akkermansiaceae bacterium]|jgi:hypothetical protein